MEIFGCVHDTGLQNVIRPKQSTANICAQWKLKVDLVTNLPKSESKTKSSSLKSKSKSFLFKSESKSKSSKNGLKSGLSLPVGDP